MTISFKKRNPEPLQFDHKDLENVHEHKHLGLTLSSNLTWSSHINNIISEASRMSDVLKRLKYDLDRSTLEKIYFSFIRPKLEYAAHIWDNCSKKDSDKLEQFQIEVARTVTGARKGTSHELLYSELKWETLSQRRMTSKLLNIHRIVNKSAPSYMSNLIPQNYNDKRYSLRNVHDIRTPKTRTETFRKSFIPSSINLWNNLEPEDRLLDYETFKTKLNTKDAPNELFYLGNRASNIKHSQLRLNCSKLNNDLYSLHVVDNPSCPCGSPIEDVYHYFYVCPLFANERQILFQSIAKFNITDYKMLLYGNNNVDYNSNVDIFNAVHTFIENTGRL